MLSPPRNKMKQQDLRSPSIPTEIGLGGQNFHGYFLDDSESDRSSARLGISRPSYDTAGKLDFSPILQTRKSTSKPKSALDKYQQSSSNPASIQLVNNSRNEAAPPTQETAKIIKESKPPEQAVNSPFRAFRQRQRERTIKKNKHRAALQTNGTGTKNTAPLKNPMKALKLGKAMGHSKQSQRQLPFASGGEICSTIEMDGSIDLHKSFPTPQENAIRTNGHKLFDNERFFTPAQQSGLSSNHILPNSSVNSIVSTDSLPLLATHPLSSPGRNQGKSLGITPAPKSSTTRMIVPYVQPSNSKKKNIFTIFVLLIQPSQKIFELVRLNYDPTKTTLRRLLQMIPANCTEEDLCNQVYTGFCRPNASSSSNKTLSNLSLTASVMARDGSCARIFCGEVLAAIPEGYTSKETQILASHIMKNPKMKKLLSKKSPFSRSRKSSKKQRSNNMNDQNAEKAHLGIQPRSNQDPYSTTNNSERFSSDVLFSPMTDTIVEETGKESMQGDSLSVTDNINAKNRMRSTKKGKLDAKLERNRSDGNIFSGDNSCNSSLSSINSLRKIPINGQFVQKVVTNIEMKNKLSNIETRVADLTSTPKSKKKTMSQPLIVDDDDASKKDTSSQFEVNLNVIQLNEIKREAAQAAKAAAEEAFSKRMEELVQSLDVPEEEKNRLLEDDDMSYHSAMSFTMNGSFATLPKDNCEFPVSVTVEAQEPPPSIVPTPFLSPHGSYGAYASELVLASPYAPVSGLKLLTPLSSQKKNNARPGPLLSPLPA